LIPTREGYYEHFSLSGFDGVTYHTLPPINIKGSVTHTSRYTVFDPSFAHHRYYMAGARNAREFTMLQKCSSLSHAAANCRSGEECGPTDVSINDSAQLGQASQ
jgi:hypothetical protein